MSFLKRLLGLEFLDEMSKVVIRQPPAPLPPPPDGYRIYTTEFDEVISVPQIAARAEPLTFEQDEEYRRVKRRFMKSFMCERLELRDASAPLIRALVQKYDRAQRERTVVSILIDHSGSMRGIRILAACIATEAVAEALRQCHVAVEIIGFTTASWQGGKSRQKWIRAGRPPNPGRLCDLRYILYRSATDKSDVGPSFADALHPSILKENIDGEALLYAAARLDPADWDRRVIVVLSDGAPVDDSTLLSDADQTILLDHLKEAQAILAGQGISVGYVALHEDAHLAAENRAVGLEPLWAGYGALRLIMEAFWPNGVEAG
jgi:cobaltochelatase CobT